MKLSINAVGRRKIVFDQFLHARKCEGAVKGMIKLTIKQCFQSVIGGKLHNFTVSYLFYSTNHLRVYNAGIKVYYITSFVQWKCYEVWNQIPLLLPANL